MLRRSQYILLLALVAAASMWSYVQGVLIPSERADAAALGIPRGNLSDLYPRWLGARELLLHGRDPYGADITQAIQTGYYGRPIDPARANDPKDQQGFAYPVYVVFLLAPTVWLPFGVVQKAFLGLLLALTAGSVLLWLRVLGWRISIPAKMAWILLALGSFPAIQGFKLQQLTLLVAALLAASIYGIIRRRFVWAAILLALASIKPQLVILPALWLLIWVAGKWRERQRFFWSLAVAELALVIGGEVLLPGWIGKFRAASVAYYQYTGGGKSVLDSLLTPAWGRTVALILVAVLLIQAWRSRHAAQESAEFQGCLCLMLATTLLVIPMFAPYNQLLLLPVAMLIVRGSGRLWRGHRFSRFLLGMAAAAVFWPWLAAAGLVLALWFLPSSTVQRAWVLPLLTNFAIPVTLWALVAMAHGDLCLRNPDV
ncbi:MAG TPA: glycosyltransferase family 87 protein [Candidatus Sulfotelmatobacter sp.]|nr:glycosyltransferase family 87 protein [Candidatus Sulfotelmatobacter sp.]